ncbi:BadF/BadG/BcrA/BcrD ATPase family protein [Tropicibacter alexandrii]|uniref:BadF/BadG/BcrA/BcrD ATPase family protein n=1 Tax=Tropicibacter alexandrii TaxID=2267683 RepID=UPI000EF494DD|nr:BadF/BadG/BcrA/BcrD ATPase family protein [Tropicibacter alexandrii]
MIGIDGGGTTCRGALIWQGRRVDVSRPGANVTSDFDGAVAAVSNVLRDLAKAAGCTLDDLSPQPAFLGLAGVTDQALASRLAAALPLARAVIEEDRRASVLDALGAATGCVAVIGTGSFLARQADHVRYVGGHGLALGDEASGAWLGREALAMALRAADGLAADDALLAGLRARLGGATGIARFAAQATPRAFAEFAPEIVAARGVASVEALLWEGARYIAEGWRALGWQPGEAACLTGGLGPVYADYLPDEMRACLTAPRGTAPDGALALAARVAEGWRGWD